MQHRAALSALLLALSGCASLGHHRQDTPVARGHDTAERACASCHAIQQSVGVSPVQRAVSFASLEMRHTVGLEGRLAVLTAKGHYGMPPVALSATELSDLRVYIESLHPH